HQMAGAPREHWTNVTEATSRARAAVDDPVIVLLSPGVLYRSGEGLVVEVLVGDEFPSGVSLDYVSISVDDHLAPSVCDQLPGRSLALQHAQGRADVALPKRLARGSCRPASPPLTHLRSQVLMFQVLAACK